MSNRNETFVSTILVRDADHRGSVTLDTIRGLVDKADVLGIPGDAVLSNNDVAGGYGNPHLTFTVGHDAPMVPAKK